uniref:Uncharacterized protein n=1 Tax=Rhizophora mucronata TaxID=61149 RepID=A0A2P2MYG5_RHIMU
MTASDTFHDAAHFRQEGILAFRQRGACLCGQLISLERGLEVLYGQLVYHKCVG